MSVKPQLISKLSSNISTLGVCNKVGIKSKNESFLTLEKMRKRYHFFVSDSSGERYPQRVAKRAVIPLNAHNLTEFTPEMYF